MATVSMPGTVLSSLMYRFKSVQEDTVGLFLGQSYQHSVSKITDLESEGQKVEKKICIQQFITVHGRHSFADNKGDVSYEKLEEILEDKGATPKSIVGWFVYRCNSMPRPSLIERYIHRSLMIVLTHITGKDLVFSLFSEQFSCLLSIEYSFYQWITKCLENIHIDIINLQSTSLAPYHTLPSVPIPLHINSHTNILKYAREQFFTENGQLQQTVVTETLCKTLVQTLESLKDELVTSYDTILNLHEEVQLLQTQLDSQTIHNLQQPISVPLSHESSIHELISLGDQLADLNDTDKSNDIIDLLTGSPPPTNHTPLTPTSLNDTVPSETIINV